MAGHVESVRPPFNTCKTKSFESKSVEKRSYLPVFAGSAFQRTLLQSCSAVCKRLTSRFLTASWFPPGNGAQWTVKWFESTADGVIWLAGVIDKRSNKRIWTTLVAKFIVSKISEIHLTRCTNRDSTVQLTDFTLHRTHSRALTERLTPFKNHSFQENPTSSS